MKFQFGDYSEATLDMSIFYFRYICLSTFVDLLYSCLSGLVYVYLSFIANSLSGLGGLYDDFLNCAH